ncbi:hypothetical protein ACLOJK_021028, partial [Asimina triloba]
RDAHVPRKLVEIKYKSIVENNSVYRPNFPSSLSFLSLSCTPNNGCIRSCIVPFPSHPLPSRSAFLPQTSLPLFPAALPRLPSNPCRPIFTLIKAICEIPAARRRTMPEAAASTAVHSSDAPWRRDPSRPSTRLPRACTSRSSARLQAPAAPPPSVEQRRPAKDEQQPQQCSKIVTRLVAEPTPSDLPRWSLRSMWEFASLLNFLNVSGAGRNRSLLVASFLLARLTGIFRPLLNIRIEFSAEELETALITPNSILDDIHIPILKVGAALAIPPVTRMALGRATWVTVLCRKLKDWWIWVADGEVPIVASHGAEVDAYKALDPGTRVLILKALCDIRVEQEDIRSYIDDSIKRGIRLSVFRKERIGGDSHGTSFWYEDDPIVGHRLYREIRKIEVKKAKAKGVPSTPIVSCQWETVATNLDEFQDVSELQTFVVVLTQTFSSRLFPWKEKLVASRNRIEAALGKRLKIDYLPEIEKIHKVSPEPALRRESLTKPEASANGSRWNGSSHAPQQVSNDTTSQKSTDYDETDGEHKYAPLDRTNRRRQRPQRYSVKEFVEAVSDNDADFDSDDDIVGEAVYDEEYLRSRKQRKISSSSEGDEEYRWDEDNAEDEEEEEEEDSLSISDDIEEPRRSKKLPSRRRGTKLRSVDEIQSGLRRSKRATRNRIDYRQYEMSESEADSMKVDKDFKDNASDEHSDSSDNDNVEDSTASQESEDEDAAQEMKNHHMVEDDNVVAEAKEQNHSLEKVDSPGQETEGVQKRRFLDLNELAPGTGFDDGVVKDEDRD